MQRSVALLQLVRCGPRRACSSHAHSETAARFFWRTLCSVPCGNRAQTMRRIAITSYENRVSSRLDYTQSILLVTLENGRVVKWEQIHLTAKNPIDKINTLKELRVDAVICGGITELCLNRLQESRITVYPWVRGEVHDVVRRFVEKRLKAYQAARGSGKR